MYEWNKNQPIFMQIRHQIVEMILNETIKAGEALPSVRQLAVQLSVNPLTVTKAYQSLVDLDLIEKRRGLGMFVKEDTRKELLKIEKAQFLKEEWPPIEKRLEILDISLSDLMKKGG